MHLAFNFCLLNLRVWLCAGWFHAEALELDEINIHNVVGFKCCRCRRIKSPKCPYGDNSEAPKTSNKPSETTVKKGKTTVKPETSMFTEFEEWMSSPPPPQPPQVEEEVITRNDDPLLFSLSRVEQITDVETPKIEVEWDEPGQGPHKLPVRRHGNFQLNADCTFENNHHAEFSAPTDLSIPKDELSSPVEWDVSNNVLETETELPTDYDINYEDMEFEPQTYFSFTELLDDGQLEGDVSGNVLGYSENQTVANSQDVFCDGSGNDLGYSGYLDGSGNDLGYFDYESCVVTQDGYPEELKTETTGISSDCLEPVVMESIGVDCCKMCCHTEPVPDLLCGSCNLLIHSHCSPWIDSLSPGSWRCGNCRSSGS